MGHKLELYTNIKQKADLLARYRIWTIIFFLVVAHNRHMQNEVRMKQAACRVNISQVYSASSALHSLGFICNLG